MAELIAVLDTSDSAAREVVSRCKSDHRTPSPLAPKATAPQGPALSDHVCQGSSLAELGKLVPASGPQFVLLCSPVPGSPPLTP